jgi:hypothetical protein
MQTPTISEREEFDEAYHVAWEFWIELNTHWVPENRYRETTEWLDSLPGVSEYFRSLCLFDLHGESEVDRRAKARMQRPEARPLQGGTRPPQTIRTPQIQSKRKDRQTGRYLGSLLYKG